MGVVVSARHVELGQRVAIKFMRGAAALDPTAKERFLREARALVALSSEHVAKVLDVGTLAGGKPYMVMEYLAGRDLGDVLRREGPMAIADAVGAVLQACEALVEAHAMGIVHRDLKPSNLFVTKGMDGFPRIKVLDFGISKMAGALSTSARGSDRERLGDGIAGIHVARASPEREGSRPAKRRVGTRRHSLRASLRR